jgi:catechol 2,3-dioxygenase-like lactoylglutathione lyase family enzyme
MVMPYVRNLNCTTLRIKAKLFSLATLALLALFPVTPAAEGVNIPALMLQPSVNLVLSVGDIEKSKEFYGDILQLKPMANLNLPGGLVMTRYQVGTTEIKLLHSDATQKTETGKVDQATGIRRLTLFLRDQQGLRDRFKTHDRPAPEFETEPAARQWSRALVSDPDGNQIELIFPPDGTPDDVFKNIELRLTVKEIENSRKFYRDFIGFKELEETKVSPEDGGKLYHYRRGNTTISLGSFGDQLPPHTGRWEEAHGIRYIQYIVRDLDAVNDYAKSSGVTIDQKIFPLGKLARIMFIADPDGIINEFVGLPK